jgi:beta-lactamase class D
MIKAFLPVCFSLLIIQSGVAQKIAEKNFKPLFEKYGVEGCFVLFNEAENEFIRYNQAVCDSGYIPASTFKIPHSVIALEEEIIQDTCQVIPWNGRQWPNKFWNQDQTLKTAIRYSCVWVYVSFAEQIGIDKYYRYVDAFNYGNKNLTGSPTRFWLAGQFRISANQQIDFLRKFFHYNLPVSHRSIDLVKGSIVLEQTSSYKLSGKTGGGMLSDTEYIMWLVGYVEKDNQPYFYAMNFQSGDYERTSQVRYALTKDILRELKLIE